MQEYNNVTHKFIDLKAWQRSVDYVVNIAESCGAGSKLEFRRFLKMAQRSGMR